MDKTTLHESTGYSSYQVNFGWSPNLPVDVMLDRISLPGEREVKETPEFVRGVNGWLKWVYDNVRWNLNKAHQRKKSKYDEKFAGENLTVINRVLILYLCCEARKNKETVFIVAWPLHNKRQGWCCDLLNTIDWTPKTLLVHWNRLKLCYRKPQDKVSKKLPTPGPWEKGSETACYNPTSPPATLTSKLTYEEVIANQK